MENSAKDFLPDRLTISNLREAAQSCRGCHLYKNAIQTVFGEGKARAELMIVGEIPGKKEDEIGKPFTGPAGTFLRNSIETVGLDSRNVYFTNVVKHFKFNLVNQKKLHRTPVRKEIKACKPWLDAEINCIKPKIILCLGATAANTLIPVTINIRKDRGKTFVMNDIIKVIVTFHPSAILRAITHEDRKKMKSLFIRDMKKVAVMLNSNK